MRKILPTTLLGVAGLTAFGLIGMSSPVVSSTSDEAAKRDDDAPSLVLVADDDDDDTNDDDTDEDTGTDRGTAQRQGRRPWAGTTTAGTSPRASSWPPG